jgi:hypothetical protein
MEYDTSMGSSRLLVQNLPPMFLTMYSTRIIVNTAMIGTSIYEMSISRNLGEEAAFFTFSSLSDTVSSVLFKSALPGYSGIKERKYIGANSIKIIFAAWG